MTTIYASASRVLVWLGDEADNSPKAVDLLKLLYQKSLLPDGGGSQLFAEQIIRVRSRFFLSKSAWFANSWRLHWNDGKLWKPLKIISSAPSLPLLQGLSSRSRVLLDNHVEAQSYEESDWEPHKPFNSIINLPDRGDPSWAALRKFINRPWFSRTWVFQEIVVAKSALILIGGCAVDWKCLQQISKFLFSLECPEEAGGWDWLRIRFLKDCRETYHNSNQDQEFLSKLLLATLHTSATDPRDKLFGIIGLVGEELPKHDLLRADYRRPVTEIYRDLTRFLIAQSKDLTLLEFVTLEKAVEGLPSWVLDWSFPRKIRSRLGSNFPSSGAYNVLIWDSPNPNQLVLGGKQLSRVRQAGRAITCNGNTRNFQSVLKAALVEWERIAVDLPKQLSGEPFAECLWRTLVGNRTQSSEEPPEHWSLLFVVWYTRLGLRKLLPAMTSLADVGAIDAKDFQEFSDTITNTCMGMKLCVTSSGDFFLAPAETKEGDVVVLFYGALNPWVLRKKNDSHTLLGPCYLHGLNLNATMEDESSPVEYYVLE